MSDSKLGRSLENLIKENEVEEKINEEVKMLELKNVFPRENQPRKHFDNQKIKELANSIDNYGIIQPIVVSKTNNGYKIIAGERRYQAALLLKLEKIPCIVRDYNPKRIPELALIENIQREDLTSIEAAFAIKALIDQYGYKHNEIANKIGKSRTYITNLIGMLSLPQDIIQDVMQRKISMGHARALSKLKDYEKIEKLVVKIKKEKLSVRELEILLSQKVNYESRTNKAVAIKFNLEEKNILVKEKSIEFIFKTNKELEKFLKMLDQNETE
jgi:ParB family chromosome partitioning protein